MKDKMIITKKKTVRGEDGYKTFSVRLKDTMVEQLNEIDAQTDLTRNELINMFLEYAIQHAEVHTEELQRLTS